MPVLVQVTDNVASHKHPLGESSLTIGRGSENDIQIDDMAVSSVHARIEPVNAEKGLYKVIDLDSTNGSFVNEKKVQEAELKHNDVIRFGFINFKFLNEVDQQFEETTKVHKSWIPGVYFTK